MTNLVYYSADADSKPPAPVPWHSFLVLIQRHIKGIPEPEQHQFPRRHNITLHTKTNKTHATVLTALVIFSTNHIL